MVSSLCSRSSAQRVLQKKLHPLRESISVGVPRHDPKYRCLQLECVHSFPRRTPVSTRAELSHNSSSGGFPEYGRAGRSELRLHFHLRRLRAQNRSEACLGYGSPAFDLPDCAQPRTAARLPQTRPRGSGPGLQRERDDAGHQRAPRDTYLVLDTCTCTWCSLLLFVLCCRYYLSSRQHAGNRPCPRSTPRVQSAENLSRDGEHVSCRMCAADLLLRLGSVGGLSCVDIHTYTYACIYIYSYKYMVIYIYITNTHTCVHIRMYTNKHK